MHACCSCACSSRLHYITLSTSSVDRPEVVQTVADRLYMGDCHRCYVCQWSWKQNGRCFAECSEDRQVGE